MNQELKRNKAIIREFMRNHYTDERLAQLYAHAKDGKLTYWSCCCFIGIPNANHALRGEVDASQREGSHVDKARVELVGAYGAEVAFLRISGNGDNEQLGRAILIPMIRAEMRRRERLSAEPTHQPVSEFTDLEADVCESQR